MLHAAGGPRYCAPSGGKSAPNRIRIGWEPVAPGQTIVKPHEPLNGRPDSRGGASDGRTARPISVGLPLSARLTTKALAWSSRLTANLPTTDETSCGSSDAPGVGEAGTAGASRFGPRRIAPA